MNFISSKTKFSKMLLKLSVFILVLSISFAQESDQNWELAVVINDQIELLKSNGSIVGTTLSGFTKLKALAYDSIRHQFIVSDMDQLNDTIFSVQLTKETDIQPIITNLPDDVQGLAIDPISDILYWTDYLNKTINFLSLKEDSNYEGNTLFSFEEANPQGIVLDACKRRIYWTNSNPNGPTIEMAKLDGTGHKIIIDSDLVMPGGITIDYTTQRLYWTDNRGGIYFRIESSNLDGSDRALIYEGTHIEPFDIAVDTHAIYYTDINNNVLWRIWKKSQSVPEKLRQFDEKPLGIISKNMNIKTLPDCDDFKRVAKEYKGPHEDHFIPVGEPQNDTLCINGHLVDDKCLCSHGYSGKSCEISTCHNFCVHGNCFLSSKGYPQCHCPSGFGGLRCEKECNGYCLNDGKCEFPSKHSRKPICTCTDNFEGARCERNVLTKEVCSAVCNGQLPSGIMDAQFESLCRCDENQYLKLEALPISLSSKEASSETLFNSYLKDPIFLTLLMVACLAFTSSLALVGYIVHLRRRPNPRIKRRYIVNKNVTPLTNRPQPSEQCEITIENCCNMNVCETPCFEPSRLQGLQGKSDDKRTLLAHMEHPED